MAIIIRIVKNNLMLINILIVQNKIQNTFGHGPSSVDIICKYKRENPHKIAKEKYIDCTREQFSASFSINMFTYKHINIQFT